MDLVDKTLDNLCNKIDIDSNYYEYKKFKRLISVTNQAYLKIALNEFEKILKNNPQKNISSKFRFLMSLYNKHLRDHQVMFLLFNIFETAIRSKAAVILSKKYSSSNTDDWLSNPSCTPLNVKTPFSKAIEKINLDNEDSSKMDSYEIFDYIMLGQLKDIYLDFWSDLSFLFEEKNVNGNFFSKLGKSKFKVMINEIRKARNDNAHHKPFHKTRKRRHQIIEDIEIILLHLDFNLSEAINNIDPSHKIITLRYQ